MTPQTTGSGVGAREGSAEVIAGLRAGVAVTERQGARSATSNDKTCGCPPRHEMV